ncbi:MAG: hypothetical protein JWM37_536 [Candidatus Saccharibacteria bacterium]|nr:hypothetical protein [Candidatus Saccharibacteria bacterium]
MKLINVYRKVLGAYPKSYQKDYAGEMVRTLEDMLHEEPKITKRARIWTTAFAELPIYVVKLNAAVLGRSYALDTPDYVKRNAAVSIACVVPFLALLSINELDPSVLPTAPRWTDTYQFLAIGLPVLAFLLCAATVMRWFFVRRMSGTRSSNNTLVDIKHNWPVVLVGSFAFIIVLFMVGHDSVHCLTDNPVNALHNPRATLQCIEKD